ncbi:MAG: alternative ribosome rescue aminoacyl-tRNA hydrolase ArfB [Halothiobacillaceae bacterium]|nr:alternative ribosome rescue aminoacyl-tRNA hydrolase ArfB [Halothiobacillaceae bacterium]
MFALTVPDEELEFIALRASGPGGQNVNKVATAVQLRYDIRRASLPEPLRERLLARKDARLSREGVLVIKAQRFNSQEKNREDAKRRLLALIEAAAAIPTPRKPTRPTRASRERRMESKLRNSRLKAQRGQRGLSGE